MKINRNNPKHWLLLIGFGLTTMLALIFRLFVPPKQHSVILYGHKLNGNLLALYNESRANDCGLILEFLTMDPAYHQSLLRQGVLSISAISFLAVWRIARVNAIVTDHGLHVMQPLLLLTNIHFFDTWHGIPFKGFDENDFRTQHRYRETWVTSPLLQKIYIERFGFKEDQVIVTGYARTDRLLNEKQSPAVIRCQLGLPVERKTIMFAPTWIQDDQGRNIYPFGTNERTFMTALSVFAEKYECTILLRPHLNTSFNSDILYPHVHIRASATHPNTEEMLLATDVLVCDWSSIAFDYLLLNRPTLFLDVPAPFKKGLTLGAEYRFSEVVTGLDNLIRALYDAVTNPDMVVEQNLTHRDKVKNDIYADRADGNAAKRCIERLLLAKV